MKMSPKFLLLTAVPTLIAFACGGDRRDPSTKAPSASVRPAFSVATVAVVRGSASLVQVPARIRSRQTAVISARISALVVSTPFREGDAVRAGETLVRLDNAPQQAAVAAAEAQLTTAESESRRISRLVIKGAGTAREAEGATARLEDARAALAAARDLLASTSLRAPFDGRIVIEVGQPRRSGASGRGSR